MRVAYVNADCGIPVFGDKGACIHIHEMIGAMREQGAEVRIVATRLGNAIPDGHLHGVLHAFRWRDPAVMKDGGRAAKELANVADAEAVRDALIALHAEWPFDMIYERYSLWSRAGIEAARRLNVPLVVEVNAPLLLEQQDYRELANSDLAAAIERDVLTGADSVVTVSSRLRDYVIERGADPARVWAMGNAVDLRRFHPGVSPRPLPLPDDGFVIGFTGSLKAWHGIDVLLDAFRLVRAAASRAHLLIVGDGPERGWIDGFVRGAGLDGAVTLTGWMNHEQLPGAIAAMDLATAPYPETADFYFSPLKLFEYLAMGRPVVASAIGQISEVIRDGDSGRLVPPGDAPALARAILAVMADRTLARRLAEGAAREGLKHSWTRNAGLALRLGQTVRKAA